MSKKWINQIYSNTRRLWSRNRHYGTKINMIFCKKPGEELITYVLFLDRPDPVVICSNIIELLNILLSPFWMNPKHFLDILLLWSRCHQNLLCLKHLVLIQCLPWDFQHMEVVKQTHNGGQNKEKFLFRHF